MNEYKRRGKREPKQVEIRVENEAEQNLLEDEDKKENHNNGDRGEQDRHRQGIFFLPISDMLLDHKSQTRYEYEKTECSQKDVSGRACEIPQGYEACGRW